MGKDLYREFPAYANLLDSSASFRQWREIMEEGSLDLLSETENTQPCMSLFAAGMVEILKEAGIRPDACGGLSLGEYGALYAAGVFSLEDYIAITAFRGRAMMEAAKGIACAMTAVLGPDSDSVAEICRQVEEECRAQKGEKGSYVTVANYNCPGQCVICGDIEAVERAEKRLQEEGKARLVRLHVSGPFHTKYMEKAGERLKERLGQMSLARPSLPLVMNYTGDFYQGEDLRELLTMQLQRSVRFEEAVKKLMETYEECQFVEIGPGKTLAGFVKKTARQLKKQVEIISLTRAEDVKLYLEREQQNPRGK